MKIGRMAVKTSPGKKLVKVHLNPKLGSDDWHTTCHPNYVVDINRMVTVQANLRKTGDPT
jgi:hypothetical protein